ncbi:hypothetical protein [Kitasatospora sp. NPDC085879]|uniref:hypothetical protein n=1 Tax=Kitasatospora sp. NPDC085879 TaxID=3154769 RepID=UPI00342BFDD7
MILVKLNDEITSPAVGAAAATAMVAPATTAHALKANHLRVGVPVVAPFNERFPAESRLGGRIGPGPLSSA